MAFGSVATITTVETSIDASGRAMQALGERWRLGSDGQRFIVPAIPLTTSRRPNAPVTTTTVPTVKIPQAVHSVNTPADEYARLTRGQKRDAKEKKRIRKAARAARDELYRARQVVKDAQAVSRAARAHASRYSYIPAPRNTRAASSTSRTVKVKNTQRKPKGSVHSNPMDMEDNWSWIKASSSSASHNGDAPARY